MEAGIPRKITGLRVAAASTKAVGLHSISKMEGLTLQCSNGDEGGGSRHMWRSRPRSRTPKLEHHFAWDVQVLVVAGLVVGLLGVGGGCIVLVVAGGLVVVVAGLDVGGGCIILLVFFLGENCLRLLLLLQFGLEFLLIDCTP